MSYLEKNFSVDLRIDLVKLEPLALLMINLEFLEEVGESEVDSN